MSTLSRPPTRVLVAGVLSGFGILIVFASLAGLLAMSLPYRGSAVAAADPYAQNYLRYPWSATLHIAPGLVYLLGAPLQLSARIRRRHLTLHRRLGRVVLACGAFAGVFALVVGPHPPFDGSVEASATAVFGSWFLACLARAYVAARRRDFTAHRRWMIRAFATGIGVGAIRVWIPLLGAAASITSESTSMAPSRGTFGVAFWLGFLTTALVGEWWLRAKPARRSTDRGPGSDRP